MSVPISFLVTFTGHIFPSFVFKKQTNKAFVEDETPTVLVTSKAQVRGSVSPAIQLLEQHSEITSQSERQGRERKPDYLCFVWNCKQHTAIV